MIFKQTFILLLLFLVGSRSYAKLTVYQANQTEEEFINQIFRHYLKTIQPPTSDSSPIDVKVNIKVNDLGHFNDRTMTYFFSYTIHQLWRDERLAFANFSKRVIKMVKMNERVWRPDLYIFESDNSATKGDESMLWLYDTGDILYSEKRGQHLNCRLNLQRFPMDEQICEFRITSFGYNRSDLNIRWLFGKEQYSKNVEFTNSKEEEYRGITEFELITVETDDCRIRDTFTGESTCLKMIFHFYRNLGFYLLHTYLPSFLVVAISWLSFLVDFTSAPARASMGFISVLTIITQTSSSISDLPRVSYTRAIDMWLFTCLAFVVTALVEFAFISSICTDVKIPISRLTKRVANHRLMKKRKSYSQPNLEKCGLTVEENGAEYVAVHPARVTSKPNHCLILMSGQKLEKSVGYRIDGIFFVFYPIFFALFNIIYWTYFKILFQKMHD